MAYCTQQDLVDRLGEPTLIEVTDLERTTGSVHADRVARACEDAAAEIDSYARARYPVPFEPVPAAIKRIAIDLAVYALFSARGFAEDSGDKAVVDKHRAAVDFLKMLARGHVTIGVPTPAKDQGAVVDGPDRVFTRSDMEGF